MDSFSKFGPLSMTSTCFFWAPSSWARLENKLGDFSWPTLSGSEFYKVVHKVQCSKGVDELLGSVGCLDKRHTAQIARHRSKLQIDKRGFSLRFCSRANKSELQAYEWCVETGLLQGGRDPSGPISLAAPLAGARLAAWM